MKKGLKYLLGLGAIAVLPFAATGTINGADGTTGGLICPEIAFAGETIECIIESESMSTITYTGISAKYALPEGITYDSFSTDHNYYVNNPIEIGFVLGDATELPSEIGKVKFTLSEDLTVGQTYTVSLVDVNYTDTEYNDYDFTDDAYSATFTIVEDVLEFDSSLSTSTTMIYNLHLGMPVSGLLNLINTNGGTSIYNAQGTLVDDNNLVFGTGYKIKFDLFKEDKEYTLSVKGDVTSDGYVKMGDVMKVANQVLDENTITGEAYLKAADATDDGNIKMGDVMKLANHVLEGGEI